MTQKGQITFVGHLRAKVIKEPVKCAYCGVELTQDDVTALNVENKFVHKTCKDQYEDYQE